MSRLQPSNEENEDLLLACRYGDRDDVQQFVNKFGSAPLSSVRDENGSSILHMVAANGHTGEPA
jgi:ankyrin repeat protein